MTEQQGRGLGLSHRSATTAVTWLSVLVILGIVIGAACLVIDLRRQELQSAKTQIASLSRVLAEQTTRSFDGITLNMLNIRDRLSDPEGLQLALDSLPVQMMLRTRRYEQPQIKSVFVADKNGYGVNSSRPDFIRNLDMRERSFFRHFAKGDDGLFISPPERARVDGQWTYYVAVRLADGQGNFRGVLVTAVSIGHFETLYQGISFDFVGRVQLLDQKGHLLAGRPHDENSIGKQTAPPWVRARLSTQPPATPYETEEDSAAGKLFSAYCNVTDFPLTISVAVREADALLTWKRVAKPIVIGSGGVLLVLAIALAIARELLRRAAIKAAIKESDEQLRHVVQSVRNDAIVIIDAERLVVIFNDSAERCFGMPAAAAIGQRIDDLLASRSVMPQCAALLRCFEDGLRSPGEESRVELIELFRDGEPYPVELTMSSTWFRGKKLFTAVFRDLTERRRAERELLKSNRQLQKLSTALESAREAERTRISREMHDELGQLLTGIRMEVSWLGRRLISEQSELAGKIASIKGLIDQTIASTRRIAAELRPAILDHLGFAAAAAWYVDQFTGRTGLPVALDLPEHELPKGGPIATTLFRLLQESLTNIARHAKASQVDVRLAFSDGYWRLAVRDDGRGFKPGETWRSGIGLIGMRERVEMLQGSLSIVSAPGEGTLVEACLPENVEEDEQNAVGQLGSAGVGA